jgi:hypothetical protein
MKQLKTLAYTLLTGSCLILSSAFVTSSSVDSCGVFTVGQLKIDLTKAERSTQALTLESLISNLKEGISFSGSQTCPGSYEITDMELLIMTDKEDVTDTYDFAMIRKMQTMENFMLVRHFGDARTLIFRDISVQNSTGDTMALPEVRISMNR